MRYLLFLTCLLTENFAQSGEFTERFSDWPDQTTITGRVAIARSLPDKEALEAILRGQRADKDAALLLQSSDEAVADQLTATLKGFRLQTSSATDAAGEDWLLQQLEDASVICWMSDQPVTRVSAALRKGLASVVSRGGVVVLIGSHFDIAGRRFADLSDKEPVWRLGLGLIPDGITTATRDDDDNNLSSYLSIKPRKFSIALSEDGMLVLSGRKFRLLGNGSAEFRVAGGDWLPARSQVLKAQQTARQDPNEYLVDLTEWRREAIERTLEPFPPKNPPIPQVDKGTLVIVGGGGMPAGLMTRFVALAGGKENAKLVYVPCAEQAEVSERQGIVEAWKRMGVEHATFIHTKDRQEANSSEDILGPLRNATGVWFGGGRQWNFADSYYGTEAQRLMQEVVARGGVAGGSSAGASIQAAYLARATPIQNFRIIAPGYERGGMGFIRGVAIDQHFTQRGRQKDMTQLVDRYPQLLGIGLDEATAIIVKNSIAEVTGRGDVYFYDRNQPVVPNEPDYIALGAGSSYDLAKREVINRVSRSEKQSVEAAGNGTD